MFVVVEPRGSLPSAKEEEESELVIELLNHSLILLVLVLFDASPPAREAHCRRNHAGLSNMMMTNKSDPLRSGSMGPGFLRGRSSTARAPSKSNLRKQACTLIHHTPLCTPSPFQCFHPKRHQALIFHPGYFFLPRPRVETSQKNFSFLFAPR